MNQSALIGGALLAGFALFIASRDRLSTYGRILWGAKPDSHAPAETESDNHTDAFGLPNLKGYLDDLEKSIDDKWSEVLGL